MWQQIRNNPRAAVLAVIAHVIFITVLLVSFTFSSDDEEAGHKGPKLEVIKAEAIDEKQINAELKRHRDAEQRQQQKIKDQARKKKEAQLREKKRKADKKKKQAAEKKRKTEKKKQLVAEKKRKLAEKKRKQKVAKEKQRKADVKKKQEREKRLAKEKKRKEIERKRIEEEERKHQQEMARQDAEMQQKLTADRQRQTAARQAANQREINKYQGLIKNAVTRHWTLPSTEVSGLVCEVKVRIIPNGEVIDVQIMKSSDNIAFDRSVKKAVRRAAPLPVPSVESGLFDEFREVIFAFEPRDL